MCTSVVLLEPRRGRAPEYSLICVRPPAWAEAPSYHVEQSGRVCTWPRVPPRHAFISREPLSSSSKPNKRKREKRITAVRVDRLWHRLGYRMNGHRWRRHRIRMGSICLSACPLIKGNEYILQLPWKIGGNASYITSTGGCVVCAT